MTIWRHSLITTEYISSTKRIQKTTQYRNDYTLTTRRPTQIP